ncbi:MAG: DUF4383 domain-containing protein [Pseudonocardiaceae bacterium]
MSTDSTRLPRVIFVAQGAVLALLGIAGLLAARNGVISSRPVTPVLFLNLTPIHSLVLLLTGIAAFGCAPFRRTVYWWAGAQFAGFAGLFAYGSAEHPPGADVGVLGLDTSAHFLHLGLAVAAAILGMILAGPFLGPDYPSSAASEAGHSADPVITGIQSSRGARRRAARQEPVHPRRDPRQQGAL